MNQDEMREGEAAPREGSVAEHPASAKEPAEGVLEYVDGILRNREDYFAGIFEDRDLGRHIVRSLFIIVVLSGAYGLVMGTANGLSWQMVSSGTKVPLLYLLTLAVCFPVLYVVNVVMGSQLSFPQTLALILLAVALNAILLASCATIVLFFTVTGSDYHFLKLLHVAIFAFSGVWAMVGLWRGLFVMCETSSLYPKQAVRILRIWVVVFGLVGAQTAWSLRPFVGSPEIGFQIFRTQEGNFYQGVLSSVAEILDKL